MLNLASFLEMLMLICFGVSWPINIAKAWKARSTKGISVLFYCLILLGYLVGIAAKLALIQRAEETGTPIISCMGAGNKLDPGQFRVADIYETRICPLARVMRKELKKRGIRKLKVVYSEEEPIQPGKEQEEEQQEDGTGPIHPRRSTPGSVSFVPSVAGLMIAGEVIRDLLLPGTAEHR